MKNLSDAQKIIAQGNREETKEGKEFLETEVRAGQSIGIQADGNNGKNGSCHRSQDGVAIGGQDDGSIPEQISVSRDRKLIRPEPVTIPCQG